ncbi:phage tail tape measure protein [Bordetella trematum]|uniref:Bacteriophage protein n=1 Tax=Bordetella trematum TaxID=123899 RepID=A0A157SJY1_9BORD|nr:phage tail tape measure protein [Bordetella trematum]AZR93242.1 phage tail tape measure protein [Bordetella trematum]NNH20892.1 phage tail tape measure protein [Bordetella trematum]SAI22849.1 bacteriophage protein [Bordetella trematum]SAI70604.1 bacteriophage protein [Bordetella trematum]SUV98735.1 bacteriophage protein [Bordetella trematum]
MDKTLQLRVIAAMQDKLSGPLKKIKQTSATSAAGVVELRDKLKALNNAQRDVGRFRELSRGLQLTRTEMANAQQRVATLAQQMQASASPTRTMAREFNSAVRAAQQLKAKHSEQSIELQRLRTSLSTAGLSASNLARDEQGLRQRIEQTNAALDRQMQKLKASASHQQRLGAAKDRYNAGRSAAGTMAGLGAGGLAAGGAALYAETKFLLPGVDFDAAMSKVQALARLDKMSVEMQALRKQARDLGAATMFSAGQAAEAQGFLAMAGFNPKAIHAAMPGMLSLAKAGDTDLAQTADIGSNILTGFNLPAEQMSRVGDVLVGAFTRSNTSLYMLGETMKYVAPVAAGVGQDIETVAAMAGKLGDAGIQGSMGGTALRAILGRLASPPKAAAKALESLKIQTKDAAGNLRDLPSILEELHKKTSKMGNAERAGIFKHIAGEEAFSGLQVLVAQAGNGELQKFIQELRQAAGEADKTAGTMADNMRGSLDELSSAWEDLGIQIYEQHDGPLRKMVTGLADTIGKVKDWAAANPKLASGLTAAAAGVAALVAGLGALTLTLASILGPFVIVRYAFTMLGIQGGGLVGVLVNLARKGIGSVGRALLLLGRILMVNPIGLAVTAIGLAAFTVYKYWEPISAFFQGLWASVRDAFTGAINGITAFLQAWNPMATIRAIFMGALEFFSGLWNSIRSTFDTAVAGVSSVLQSWNPMGFIRSAFAGIGGFFGETWETVSTTVTAGIGAVGKLLAEWSPLALLSDAINSGLQAMGLEIPAKFSDLGGMLMQGLVNGITNAAGAVKEAISNMGGGVIGWFKEKLGIKSPSRVFMGMGEFVSDGAAVGIDRHAPAAAQAAQALAASVAKAGELASLSPSVNLPQPSALATVANVAAPPVAPHQMPASLQMPPADAPALLPTSNDPQPAVSAGISSFAAPHPQFVRSEAPRIPLALEGITAAGSAIASRLVDALRAAQGVVTALAIGGTVVAPSSALAASPEAARPSAISLDPDTLASRFDMRPTVKPTTAPRSVVVQGDTIAIHIHGAGSSPADIARAVESALQRRDAERQARVRSAYFDPN